MLSFLGDGPGAAAATAVVVFVLADASNCCTDCCPINLRDVVFSKSGEPDGRLGGKASRMVPVA